jgi:uncharacterized protein
MEPDFYIAAVIFHAALIAVAWWIGRRASHRERLNADNTGWALGLAGDVLLFIVAITLLGLVTGRLIAGSLFAAMRFACQGLFGELVALAVWLAWTHARARRPDRAAVPVVLALTLMGVYWQAYHREPRQLVVRHHRLDVSRTKGPARVLRIVHLSDIQTDEIGAHERRALAEAMRQRPDLIVLTGDYTMSERASADFRHLIRAEGFAAPLGIYAVPGDVADDSPKLFAGLGVTWLENRHVVVPLPDGRSMAILGLGTAMSRTLNTRALVRLVEAMPRADVSLVLGHSPDFISELAGRVSIDLALAGHTHGGQVVLPFFGPPMTLSRLPRRYAGDLNDYDGIPIHVSRGLGMEGGTAPRIRFLCPPELCVLDLTY